MYVNGVASDTRFISTGVPQGSILGPLLFIISINDLPKSSTVFSTRLYADDTSLTASGSDLDGSLREINSHLPAVYEWLCSNKLTLQSSQVKRTPQESINEFIIQKLNPLLAVDFRLISALLHE